MLRRQASFLGLTFCNIERVKLRDYQVVRSRSFSFATTCDILSSLVNHFILKLTSFLKPVINYKYSLEDLRKPFLVTMELIHFPLLDCASRSPLRLPSCSFDRTEKIKLNIVAAYFFRLSKIRISVIYYDTENIPNDIFNYIRKLKNQSDPILSALL